MRKVLCQKKNILWLLLLPIVLFACNRKVAQLGKSVEQNKLVFDYFYTKAKVKYTEGGTSVQANLYLKMDSDDMIWASISKLGKEAIRVKLTPDTTWFLNKYPADKRCYAIFSTQDYLKKIGVNVAFKSMQDVFLGNHPVPISKKDHVKITDSETNITQVRNGIEVKTKLKTVNSKLLESHIHSNTDTISIYFNEYKNIQGKLVPTHLTFNTSTLKDSVRTHSEIDIRYTKPKFSSTAPSFTFKIPSGYEECK